MIQILALVVELTLDMFWILVLGSGRAFAGWDQVREDYFIADIKQEKLKSQIRKGFAINSDAENE